MSSDSHPVVGVMPDVTEQQFSSLLAGSPALPAAHAVYAYCVARKVSPLFLLAMFNVESKMGWEGTARQTHSWGNTRAPVHGGVMAVGVTQGRSGVFPVFKDWVDGGISTVARFVDYAPYKGKTTIEAIIPVWAPPTDLNDTQAYINSVLSYMDKNRSKAVTQWPTYDLRGSLPTRKGGGSGQRNSNKQGGILHYSAVDYPRSRSMVDILTTEANFHIGPYLNEAGIAYHKSVDPYTGARYILRDPDEVLWHCGYWGAGGNGTGIAYHIPGGNSLVMTDIAIQSLISWVEEDRVIYGFGREMFKGHKEVSETACPGPLMNQVVLPYRSGKLSVNNSAKVPIIVIKEDDVAVPPVGVTQVQVIDGQAVVVTNYGPPERDVVAANVNTVDQGVTVTNKDGDRFSRSQRNNVMGDFGMVEPRR